MKIIKPKINNFLLPLFLLTLSITANTCVANAQNAPPEGTATVASETQDPVPSVGETPTITSPQTEIPTPKKQAPDTKPAENQPTAKNNEESTKSSPTDKQLENEQPDPQKNKSASPQEDKPKTTKELVLPEVSDNEIQENPPLNLELPPKDSKNTIKTVVSWLLMGIGLLVIIKVIVSNFKIPRNYEPHTKSKHSFKPGKRKSKYNLKYK